jgi:type II secretory pathway pseudopilin PulG
MWHAVRHRRSEEDGALLLILMVGVAVMSITIGVAAQAWSSTWRRDNEEELIFRGGQYVDALLAYRKEHGGQFPTNLTDLMKPGPRQVRYIRKLFRDPVNPSGQWGLLYLMPGGQGIYDPVLAQKQQGKQERNEDGMVVGGMPGVTPIVFNQAGTPGINPAGGPGGQGGPAGRGRSKTGGPFYPSDGTGGTGGQGGRGAPVGGFNQGSLGQSPGIPGGGAGTTVGAPKAQPASGEFTDEEPSEPPIGWPVVGVISRAPDMLAEKTFKVYKGHETIDEWQFHVFERGIDQPQAPTGTGPRPNQGCGPGYGGKGIGCVGEGPNPNRRGNWPSQNPKQ